MKNFWYKFSDIRSFKALDRDIAVNTAVIGGGLAGILTAYFLKEKGIDAVVLEANTIASGQTGGTTAKITSQHDDIYRKLKKSSNTSLSKKYAAANENAIKTYEKIIHDKSIDCDFSHCSSYLYSLNDDSALEKEYIAAKESGIDAELTKDTELPFKISAALKFNNQAVFNPVKFIAQIIDKITIYEHSKVTSVTQKKNQSNKEDFSLITVGNNKVTAKNVVFACHYPIINTPGYYFFRMHQERSYVIALRNAQKLNNVYKGIDNDFRYSLRSYNGFLLFGGKSHRTGEHNKNSCYTELFSKAKKYWKNSVLEAKWSAQDCLTLDNIPYIGKFSSSTDNWFVATGFKKWGMTHSMISAEIISSLISNSEGNKLDKIPKYADIFCPQRFKPSESLKNLLNEGIHAVEGLTKSVINLPNKELDNFQCNQGGIVEIGDDEYGVYRDTNGKFYIVNPRCTHLGCRLEWNCDEKTWDCPCHGSRFDYMGNLLDNPAQKNITVYM